MDRSLEPRQLAHMALYMLIPKKCATEDIIFEVVEHVKCPFFRSYSPYAGFFLFLLHHIVFFIILQPKLSFAHLY